MLQKVTVNAGHLHSTPLLQRRCVSQTEKTCSLGRSPRITTHLPTPEGWKAELTYRVIHGNAPRYLEQLNSTADVPGRRALRSAGTNRLVVLPVRLSTVGSRAFPVAAAQIWNSLPEHIVSAPTLQSFRRHYKKTFLLQQSFCL